jgi:hypothetical protein
LLCNFDSVTVNRNFLFWQLSSLRLTSLTDSVGNGWLAPTSRGKTNPSIGTALLSPSEQDPVRGHDRPVPVVVWAAAPPANNKEIEAKSRMSVRFNVTGSQPTNGGPVVSEGQRSPLVTPR